MAGRRVSFETAQIEKGGIYPQTLWALHGIEERKGTPEMTQAESKLRMIKDWMKTIFVSMVHAAIMYGRKQKFLERNGLPRDLREGSRARLGIIISWLRKDMFIIYVAYASFCVIRSSTLRQAGAALCV